MYVMLYSIIYTEKFENKYDLNQLILSKKSIDLKRDLIRIDLNRPTLELSSHYTVSLQVT